MGEQSRPTVDDIFFIKALIELGRMSNLYKTKYLAKLSAEHMDNDSKLDDDETKLDEDEVSRQVRSWMDRYVESISIRLHSVEEAKTLKDELLERAEIVYIPKSSNVPVSGQEQLTPEQRIFSHVRERIEDLHLEVKAMLSAYSKAFAEIEENNPIGPETFDVPCVAFEDLLNLISEMEVDYPPLVSPGDRVLIQKALENRGQDRLL